MCFFIMNKFPYGNLKYADGYTQRVFKMARGVFMKKNKKLFFGLLGLLVIMPAFGMVFLGCAFLGTASTGGTTGKRVTFSETGLVQNTSIPEKQFDILGLIYATSVSEFDVKGSMTSTQEGVMFMLLREAERLGGHDILNLRISENVTENWIEDGTDRIGSGGQPIRGITNYTKTVTYTGSALAIKYRN